ncbi:unnamed protein product, partial [Coregonus sp. 'balchen']
MRVLECVFLLALISGVCCDIKLDQSTPQVKRPGDTVKISCKISGFSMSGYWIHWMRQNPGNVTGWIGRMNSNSPVYSDSLNVQFTLTEDVSTSIQFLEAKSLLERNTDHR